MDNRMRLCAIMDMLGLDSDWVLGLDDKTCRDILDTLKIELIEVIDHI